MTMIQVQSIQPNAQFSLVEAVQAKIEELEEVKAILTIVLQGNAPQAIRDLYSTQFLKVDGIVDELALLLEEILTETPM